MLILVIFQKVSLLEIIGDKLSLSLNFFVFIDYRFRLSSFSFIDYRYRSTQISAFVPITVY